MNKFMDLTRSIIATVSSLDGRKLKLVCKFSLTKKYQGGDILLVVKHNDHIGLSE